MPKIISTVEARMGSSRLPGKTLKYILGKPVLELLLERLSCSQTLDDIVVATSTNLEDDPIADLCEQLGFKCFRGSATDVLGRVVGAAQMTGADVIAQITGDCILTCAEVVDNAVSLFLKGNYDYISNLMVQTYPQGVDTRVFRAVDLEEIDTRLAGCDKDAREHVYLYFEEHPERYRLYNMVAPAAYFRPDWRLDLDYTEDLELLTRIFEELYPDNPKFTLGELIRFLDSHPQLKAINQNMIRKPLREQ